MYRRRIGLRRIAGMPAARGGGKATGERVPNYDYELTLRGNRGDRETLSLFAAGAVQTCPTWAQGRPDCVPPLMPRERTRELVVHVRRASPGGDPFGWLTLDLAPPKVITW